MSERLKLEHQLCFPLYAASNLITRLYRPLLEALDLTYPQYLVMLALWEASPRSVGELGKLLYLDSGTLTPLLKRLQSAGLIERERAADDERRVLIRPTAKATALRRRAAQVPDQLLCRIPLPTRELAALRAQVRKLVAALGEPGMQATEPSTPRNTA